MAEIVSMVTDRQKDIKLNMMALLVFLCGATNDIGIKLIGEFYVSEILILITAVFTVILSKKYEAYNSRLLTSFLLVGSVSLIGYMISDIYIGTEPSQYLRGWGRTIILISNCFAIMLLAMKSRQNLWWFMLGSGIGGVIYLYYTGVPFQIWKLGYGERVTMIFLALIIILPRRLWVMALLGYGILNVVLDYRSLGAGLLVTAAILKACSIQSSKRFAVLMMAGLVMFVVLIVSLALTKEENMSHRVDSDIGRISGLIVSLRAIAHSPFIGYGSWTVNKGFAKELREEIKNKRAESKENVDFTNLRSGIGFQSHSQILQSWIEGGVLGAVFFLFYGYQLLQSISWCALKRSLDVFAPIFAYTVVMGIWNLFMSPFLGFGRMQIALAVGVIVILMIEKKGKSKIPSQVTSNNISSEPIRVLHKVKTSRNSTLHS